MDEIVLGLDKGHFTMAVFLDIKKSFDTIDQKIVLKKLRHDGVGERTVLLIRNYLHKRKQCVIYNWAKSDVKSLSAGVPQGSTLGPLLFLLYINDLPHLFTNTKCMMFAYDTVLYQTKDDVLELYTEMQESLNTMQKWCENNQITLNTKKCEYIYFSYRKPTICHLELKLGINTLKQVKQYKYLGTVVDEKLNGEAQYNYITQVLSFRKQTFSKTLFLMDQKTAISLYKSTIQPIFD